MPKILLLTLTIGGTLALAHAQLPSPTPDIPRARVMEVARTPEGGLLVGIWLYASSSKPLNLSRPPAPIKPGQIRMEGDTDPLPFTLAGSTLRDLFTEQVYPCLDQIPDKPYLGPMDVTGTLAPGGWMQMGVAFPPIPPPPLKDGKKQPYQLLFAIPQLKIQTKFKLDAETLQPVVD